MTVEKQGTQAFYRLAVHKKFSEVESLIHSTIRIIDQVNSQENESHSLDDPK